MILLKSLKLTNFLSHPETMIEFDGNTRLSIDGVSGAGKSAIIEAIIWCLYGRGRVDNRSLVFATASSSTVCLELLDDERVVVVERSITVAGKHSLKVCEINIDGTEHEVTTGTKMSQEWIVKNLLHASYELFINSVAYPQDNTDTFVKQTAAKRKDLLLEIASVEDFEEYYNRAKLKLASTDEKIQCLRGEATAQASRDGGDEKEVREILEQAEENVAFFEAEIEENDKALITARKDFNDFQILVNVEREKIEASKKKLTEYNDTVSSIETDIANKERRIVELGDILKEKPTGTVSGLMDEIGAIDDRLHVLTDEKNAFSLKNTKLNSLIQAAPADPGLEVKISSYKQKLADIVASSASKCTLGDECKNHQISLKTQTSFIEEQIAENEKLFSLYLDKVEEHKAAVKLATEELGKEPDETELNSLLESKSLKNSQVKLISSFENATNEMSTVVASIEEKKKELSNLTTKLSDTESLISDLEEKVKTIDFDAASEKVKALEYLNETSNKKITESRSVIVSQKIILERIIESKKRLKEIDAELEILNRDKEALLLIKDAFGSKGIKAVAVDVLIPQLEKSINDVLEQLSDFRVTLETQKSSVSGENQIEGLFINVHNPQGQSMEYNAFSGGEKVKVTVAIAEALAGLQNVGFRLLDEAIVGLDEDSVISFTEAMQKIQTKFPQMLVISHIPQIKELFENKIDIGKTDGISIIT